MGIEIERKFLINNEKLIELLEFMPHCSYDIWQYYMSEDIRLRIATHSDGHEVANFTIKTDNKTLMTRNEFESIVSIEDAKSLAHVLTKSEVGLGPVRKSRHVFNHDGTVKWEVDIFHGSNEGLIIAEVEIPNEDYDLKLAPYGWIGKEVTEDERYYNSNLAKNPYKNWSKEK
jgi:CYTH domain-containing protein